MHGAPAVAPTAPPGKGAGDAPLAVLATRLEARLDELTQRVLDAIVEAEPSYRDGVTMSREELWTSVRESLAQFVAKLVDPDAGTLHYLSFLTEMGRRRVEQGLGLDAVLHAFRIGARTVWLGLREEADRLGLTDSAALVDAASVVWELHEAASARIGAAYREATVSMLRRREREREALVDGLLSGRGQEASFTRDAAVALRLPLDGRYVVVVAETADQNDDPLPDAERILTSHGVTSAWRGGPPRTRGIVDLGRADVTALCRLLDPVARGRVGVSGVVTCLRDLPAALPLAEAALESLPEGSVGVALLGERLPAALLAAAPHIADVLVRERLGPVLALPPDEAERLLETLEAYADAGGSATETAARIHCHRNTVLKRLRRFEDLTGASLADPPVMLTTTLAVKAVRLRPTAP